MNFFRCLPLFLFFALLMTISVNAEESMQNDCASQSKFLADEFLVKLQQGDTAGITKALGEWESLCGLTEPLFRARLLYHYSLDNSITLADSAKLLDFAIAFDVRQNLINQDDIKARDDYFALYPEYFGHIPIDGNFDRQTRLIAQTMKFRAPANTPVGALVRMYAGETASFFQTLKNGGMKETRLAHEYAERVRTLQRMPEYNFGLQLGAWVPHGDLTVIGIRPLLGVYAGVALKNTSINATFGLRMGQSSNPFKMTVKDTLVSTRHHQGGFLGLELIQYMITGSHTRWGVFATGGYDLIDMVETIRNPTRQTFGSWALHTGFRGEYIRENRSRITFKASYTLLNHKHDKGSPLGGNALEFSVGMGITDNPRRNETLKRLGY